MLLLLLATAGLRLVGSTANGESTGEVEFNWLLFSLNFCSDSLTNVSIVGQRQQQRSRPNQSERSQRSADGGGESSTGARRPNSEGEGARRRQGTPREKSQGAAGAKSEESSNSSSRAGAAGGSTSKQTKQSTMDKLAERLQNCSVLSSGQNVWWQSTMY